MKFLRLSLAALLSFAPCAAYAGALFNQVPKGNAAVTYWQLVDGTFVPVSAANPLPITGGAGGGGGAATVADGADVTQGAKADAKSTATDTTPVTAMQVLKQISASVQAPPSQAVTNGGTFAVQASQSGTFTVQPGNTANTTAWKVDGSAVTQPVSIATAPVLVAGSALIGHTDGAGANNASVVGNPNLTSGVAQNAEPTLATNGQNATLALDLAHKLIVAPYANPENLVQGTTAAMTGTTSTSLLAAPGAGLKNYVTNLTCVNSHATVGTFITVQDGSGGTALYTLAAAAVFGGATVSFPAPLRQPTANTALFVADVTTGANVICSASGYKGQ